MRRVNPVLTVASRLCAVFWFVIKRWWSSPNSQLHNRIIHRYRRQSLFVQHHDRTRYGVGGQCDRRTDAVTRCVHSVAQQRDVQHEYGHWASGDCSTGEGGCRKVGCSGQSKTVRSWHYKLTFVTDVDVMVSDSTETFTVHVIDASQIDWLD